MCVVVYVCLCVCVRALVCACECVRVREREGEAEGKRKSVCEREESLDTKHYGGMSWRVGRYKALALSF